MTYPVAHGSGGFAIGHGKTTETNKPHRSNNKLHCRHRNSNPRTSVSVPTVRHIYNPVRQYIDCSNLYWNFYRSLLSTSPFVRMVTS
jgi:hypothetical protein